MSATIIRTASLAALLASGTAMGNDRLENDAKRIFNLADVTIQELELPDQPGTPAVVEVDLQGLPFTLAVKPHSVRTLGYQLYEDNGNGLIVRSPGETNTFRGEVLEDPGSVVAGALLHDGFYAKVMLTSGDMYWIEPLMDKTSNAVYGDHAVYHQDDVLATPGVCGSDRLAPVSDPGTRSTDGGSDPAASSFLSIAELGCDADFQFYNMYGSVSGVENRINLVINTMNTQYEDEVDITHEISVIIVRTTNGGGGYTSNDPGTLLEQVRTEWTTNQSGQPRDIAELFTGKNLSGSVIGIAWLGVVCNFSFGYSVVQSNCCGSLSCATDLSAHELGHNWNAGHCSCSTYTMNSGLTCSNRFNDTATEPDIIAHRDSRNCLDLDINGDVLFVDTFESGNFNAGGWTISSNSRCKVKGGGTAYTGNYGAKLKKGGQGTGACTVGTSETWIHTPSFSTAGYSSVEILLHGHFRQNELNCEAMDIQYSVSGGAWTTFASIEAHPWAEYNIAVPAAAAGQSNVRIRFITNAKGAKERAEIDNFCVIAN